MTDRLRLAFEEAARLPEAEQDRFADFLLAELRDEPEWQAKFSSRPDALEKLVAEARAEHKAGKTELLENLFR